MAISHSDGSITLLTEVDTSGIKKGMNSIKSNSSSVMSSLDNLGKKIITVFSVQKLLQFSLESSKFAMETEASVQRLIDIYGDANNTINDFIEANARALGMSKSSAKSYAAVYGNLFSVWADQESNASLTADYLNMTAVVASKTGRTMEDVQERIRSGLLGNTEAVEDLGIFVNVKTIEMSNAFNRIADGRSWEQLNAYEQSQVRTLAILEQATEKYGSEVAETAAITKSRYQAAYEDFMNTWGQVVNKVLLPLMEVATAVLDIFVDIFEFFGGSTNATNSYSGSVTEATKNQNAFTDSISDTNKELKKSIASFDDLSILTESSGSANSLGNSANGSSFTADYSGIDGIVEKTGEIKGNSEDTLSAWETFIYDVVGDVSMKNFGNLYNSMLMLETSAGRFFENFNFSLDPQAIIGDIMDWWATGTTSANTFLSGLLDVFSSLGDDDLNFSESLEGAYQGVGRMLGAIFQLMPDWVYKLMSEITGIEIDENFFLPITEDIENVYGELSEMAIKSLAEYRKAFAAANTNITKVIWSGETITPDSSESMKAQFTEAFDVVEGYIADSESKAVESLNRLVENGFLTDAEAKDILNKTTASYEAERKVISDNEAKIYEILEKAGEAERQLTTEEQQKISKLLEDSNNRALSLYNSNISDRESYLKGLSEQSGKWDERRLSQVIQLANEVHDEKVKAAEEDYEAEVAAANTLYYELGTISKTEYDNIIKKAEEKRDKAIDAAEEERSKVVSEAQKEAGGISAAVDSESGVILSKWEILWNGMWEGVKKYLNLMIDAINGIIRLALKPAMDVAGWFGAEVTDKEIPQIPHLARGAVIPGGHEFLAVLGDQPAGQTNIEAPLQTIVDAFNIALSQNGGYNGGNTEVILEIDGREFGRAVVDQGNRENRRIGTRMVVT